MQELISMFNSKILILWINIKGEVKEAFKKIDFQLFFSEI